MQQSQDQEPFERTKQAANVLLFILLALSVSLEVFTRRRFGPRYFGFHTLAAFIGIPFWTAFWPGENALPLLVFWALFVVMLIRARVESAWLNRAGLVEHSRFNGVSRIARFFKKTPEWLLKGWTEPFAAFMVGALLLSISLPLGSYLMCAAFAMGAGQALARSVQHGRALDMHDSLIDQQINMERFHELRDRDRW